jgi:zinc transport system ATP-binding protein
MDRGVSLRAYNGEIEVFSSKGSWLHPLFELEEYLGGAQVPPESLRIEDKIVGRAAALLLVRLGIREVAAGVLSDLGREVLELYSVRYSAEETVERIECQTESILAAVEDPEQAYRIVAARAGR